MKKNRFIKIAAAVFTLCLITTCGISTTLAKYTTGGSATDSARVAKWGVQLTMEGDPLFHNEYAGTDNAITVSADTQVVAPGTASEAAESSSRFSITGTPEVAVQIVIGFDFSSDVFLAPGTYQDPTKAAVEKDGVLTYKTFTLDEAYYPVVFTLTQTSSATGEVMAPVSGNLAFIQAAINNWTKSYAPNTNLAATFELSWVWAFNGDDAADTYLGNLAAGLNPDNIPDSFVGNGGVYSTTLAYSLSITVTQID